MATQHKQDNPSDPAAGKTSQHGGVENQPGRGPTGIEGVEASDLPDQGRGPVETDYGKEAARKTPDRTGGIIGGDVGMRGTPDAAAADDDGGRKRN